MIHCVGPQTLANAAREAMLVPVPLWARGIEKPWQSLAGEWRWLPDSKSHGDVQKDFAYRLAWNKADVPGEIHAATQVSRFHTLATYVDIPHGNGQRFLLRFGAVNHRARVFVDGRLAACHTGSFTAWACDVTGFVTQGQRAFVVVEIDAECPVSPHNSCGILREPALVTLPAVSLACLHINAWPAENGANAQLSLRAALSATVNDAALVVSLFSPDGEIVMQAMKPMPSDGDFLTETFSLKDILPWNAEHPLLYTLRATLTIEGVDVETVQVYVGFRRVTVCGPQMLVNGVPVKLRGICRRSVSPQAGRVMTFEQMEREIRLYKAANINYVHCLYEPPGEAFLSLCDLYGLYVKVNAAIAEVDSQLPATQNDPALRLDYLAAVAEMAEESRNHPCVLMWGLGVESSWGENFRLAKAYLRALDDGRPVAFHLPMTLQNDTELPDIWPVHNCAWNLDFARHYDHMRMMMTFGSMDAPGYVNGEAKNLCMPVLHDQIARIPCNDRETLRTGPGIRLFWGESIRRMWDTIWKTPSALGAAVPWGIDDADPISGRCTQGGILDEQYREKPEYQLLRKAYAPVRLSPGRLQDTDGALALPVENRFCHTNLRETSLHWQCGDAAGVIPGPDCSPGTCEKFFLPVGRQAIARDGLSLRLVHGTMQIDEAKIVPDVRIPLVSLGSEPLRLHEKHDHFRIENGRMLVLWDKATGMIKEAAVDGAMLLCGGPSLHVRGWHPGPFALREITAQDTADGMWIRCKGHHGRFLDVTFDTRLTSDGTISTSCVLDAVAIQSPGSVRMRAGFDCGGLDELGISFLLPEGADRLWFSRQQPEDIWLDDDHVGRRFGISEAKPARDGWASECRDLALEGPFDLGLRPCRDFRALRPAIHAARIDIGGDACGVFLHGDPSCALRLQEDWSDHQICCLDHRIRYTGLWHAVEDPSGSFGGVEMYSHDKGSAAEFAFEGCGVIWYGSRDMIGGCADVYVDGIWRARVDQMTLEEEMEGISRGYEKRYGNIVYATDNLDMGKHILRIVVTAEHSARAQGAYVMIDAFQVVRKDATYRMRLHALSAYNFTRIAGGNYTRKPIHPRAGDRLACRLTLIGPRKEVAP